MVSSICKFCGKKLIEFKTTIPKFKNKKSVQVCECVLKQVKLGGRNFD